MSENEKNDGIKEIMLFKKAQLPSFKLISFPRDIEEFLKASQDENRRLKSLTQNIQKSLKELNTIFQHLERLVNIENPDPEEVREYLRVHLHQGYNYGRSLDDLIKFLTFFPSVTEENLEHLVLETVHELNYPISKKATLDKVSYVLVDRTWLKFALKSSLTYLLENFELPSPELEFSLNEFEDFLILSLTQQEVSRTSYFPEENFSSPQIRLIEIIFSTFGGKFWFQLDSNPEARFFRSSITGTIEQQHFSKITLYFTLPHAGTILKE
ncbi:MAG: hypothetical protein ACFFBD_01630 [Candidatus Hodarchaeota archaeon]